MDQRSLVALVGGPDVDARIPLVRELSDRFRLLVYGSDHGSAERFEALGIPFRSYPLSRRVSPIGDCFAMRRLAVDFRSTRPDVVHAFDTKPGIYACIAARRAGVPVVASTITGLGSLYSGNSGKTRILRVVYESLQRMACRSSDLTVFQNADDERTLLALRIAQQGKTAVVPGSGVDTRLFGPSRAPTARARVRSLLGIADDAVVVTMISRITRSKGAMDFAHVARHCQQAGPSVRFLVVGPDDRDSVDRLSPQELAELQAAALWVGPRKDVPDLLAASDVFVLPSCCREGIPRVLLEAAASGLPLVTTDTPGCNEACRDGENGYCVPKGDVRSLERTVSKLVADADLRHAFGAASLRLARERFDLRVVASQIARLWEEKLLATRRLQPATTSVSPTSNILSK